MKKKLFSSLFITLLVVSSLNFFVLKAASITNLTITPTSQNQLTLTNVTATFLPNTPITTGSILTVTYDVGFTGGATLTNTDISVTGTNIISKVCSGFSVGLFTCTLTTSASVTTLVTIVIGGANKLTTPILADNYPFSVTVNIGGLGTTFDSGAGLAYISSNSVKENEVEVSAYVPPTVSLEIFTTGTNTKLTDPNTCGLGVLSLTQVNTCTYDVGVGTNNATGATVKVTSDGKLRQGATNFTDTSGTITAATEAYGIYISSNGTIFTPAGLYGTSYQPVPQTIPIFATSASTSDSLVIANHFTVTHAAAMSIATQVGSYKHKLTYTAFTN